VLARPRLSGAAVGQAEAPTAPTAPAVPSAVPLPRWS